MKDYMKEIQNPFLGKNIEDKNIRYDEVKYSFEDKITNIKVNSKLSQLR
ncbi:hypothetical protein [Thermohalobacter berrensis]|nr:hypothetical protein [Thermohalobacter berrensis]